ncbi:hypothetical protein [Roseobacter weihaiensis]|uniref:hypothetical protein n=1 Tax=Roseobacter weihaiensis TaxID=2763262 RepID=UPI001D0AAA7C|nr:hypothetical protein [Roseobacter sp. H9]
MIGQIQDFDAVSLLSMQAASGDRQADKSIYAEIEQGQENLIASAEISGDLFLGVGARGGSLNWAGVAIDVGEAGEAVIKLFQDEPLTPKDNITLYGLVEGGFVGVGGFASLVEKLLGSEGMSFSGHANVQVDLAGRADGQGLRLNKITVIALPIVPERTGARFIGNDFRDWSTVLGTHSWIFNEDGTVEYSADIGFGAGSFGVLGGSQPGDPFALPGSRGLTYVLTSKKVEELSDVNYALSQLGNHVPVEVPGSPRGSSQVISRGADILMGADVARAIGNAFFGEPKTNPDGRFKTTNVRGWLRMIQAVTPDQFATPPNVPMAGVFIEANARLKIIEDGIPELRIKTSNSDEPLLVINKEDVEAAFDKIRTALEDISTNGANTNVDPINGSDSPFHSGPRKIDQIPKADVPGFDKINFFEGSGFEDADDLLRDDLERRLGF